MSLPPAAALALAADAVLLVIYYGFRVIDWRAARARERRRGR